VAAERIRVNAVRPGVIYTDIHASGGEANRVDRVKSSVPMQRGGRPRKSPGLSSAPFDEASYTTGAILEFSGGDESAVAGSSRVPLLASTVKPLPAGR